ncbi:hypothetical protein [Haploplasma axanthum]|uniref:Uncharacterized protein n=1 Tax=Haploplasma axanthum TaxID=29552 RepID=A0A449BFD7_HAPAX|nr:hypothetical protein [Haploplasma axanthum]VEU81152.1 Uncharacterised protein [Haploplasma axanthum]
MKWIGRVLYGIVVVIIGMMVVRYANMNKQVKYYNSGIDYLKNGQIEEYMEVYMTATMVESYLKDPIYHAKSEDEAFPFEFSVYQAKVGENKYLVFFLKDNGINYKELVSDKEKYNEDKVIIRLNIFMNGEESPITDYYPASIDKRLPISLVAQNFNDKKEMVFSYQVMVDKKNQVKETSKIDKFELVFEDYTKVEKEDDKPITKKVASIVSDDEVEMSKTFDLLKKEDDVLQASGFNGSINEFNKDALYDDSSNLGKLRVDDFKKYQKIVTNTVVVFALIATVITYLIFFLKPTINYINDRKYQKKAAEEIEVIKEEKDN